MAGPGAVNDGRPLAFSSSAFAADVSTAAPEPLPAALVGLVPSEQAARPSAATTASEAVSPCAPKFRRIAVLH